MSTQRYDAPPVRKRPGTQAQAQAQARPPQRRDRERETLDDAAMMYDDVPMTSVPKSARRYRTTQEPEQQQVIARPIFDVQVHRTHSPIPPRRSYVEPPPVAPQRQAPSTSTQQHTARRRLKLPRWHPLLYIGLTMCACVALWMLISAGVNAWNFVSDNITYGTPRTAQYDVVVGHADSSQHPSHFIALNLNGHSEVIEQPGGDATHMHVYLGPVLFGQDLTPVTLTFKDVNGDGKPDMLLHIESQVTQIIVFINTGSTFRPSTPSDHISL